MYELYQLWILGPGDWFRRRRTLAKLRKFARARRYDVRRNCTGPQRAFVEHPANRLAADALAKEGFRVNRRAP